MLSPLLLALLAAAVPPVSCDGCAPLPPELELPGTCAAVRPTVFGEAHAGPSEPGVGRLVEGLWIGLSGRTLYAFAPGERQCFGLGSLASLAGLDASLRIDVVDAPLPLLNIVAEGRRSACDLRREIVVIARLPSSGQWTLLARLSEAEERCGQRETEARRKLLALHRRGAEAWERGNLAPAQEALRSALPLPRAAADLGALLLDCGRLAEAEPLLLFAAARAHPTDRPEGALCDLYRHWEKPALAQDFHRRHLRRAASGLRRSEGEPRYRFCTDALVEGELSDTGAPAAKPLAPDPGMAPGR